MRHELTDTLTALGVSVPRGANVESLVRTASTWMQAHQHMAEQLQERHEALQQALRESLTELGRDPGAHALVSDMVEELVRLAKGRVIR